MLEQQQCQLVNGIRELYKGAIDNSCWSGAPLTVTATGHPLTHDILERIGALKVEPFDEDADFEDDFAALRRTAAAHEAERMTPRPSTAGSSFSSSQASCYGQQPSPRMTFDCDPVFLPLHHPQPHPQFPPTPPDQSPSELSAAQFAPYLGAADPSMAMQSGAPPSHQAQQQTWVQPPGNYDPCMDFMSYDVVPSSAYNPLGLLAPKASNNPCLPIPMNFLNETELEQLRRHHVL